MIIFIFIILPPILLLLIFPTCLFNKLSRHLKPRWAVSIQIFVDTIQGCYKDGTDVTRDYRAVSRYLLAVCLLIPAFQVVTILQPKELLKCLAYTALLIAQLFSMQLSGHTNTHLQIFLEWLCWLIWLCFFCHFN